MSYSPNINTLGTADQNFAGYKAIAMSCDNGAVFPTTPTEGQWFYRSDIFVLYMYTNSNWQAICSFGTLTLYVDGTLGSDTVGKGYTTGSGATATIQYAVNLLPKVIGGNVVINVAAGTYREQVSMYTVVPIGNYTVTIQGATTQWYTSVGNGTGFATGGTTTTLIKSDAAWTPNQFQYKLLRILSGNGAGQESIIVSNDATTITVQGNYIATPNSTTTFQIVDWATRVTGANVGADTTPVRSYGFYCAQSANIKIQYFLINYCTLSGIRATQASVGIGSVSNTIHNAVSTGYGGVCSTYSSYAYVNTNHIYSCGVGVSAFSTSSINIQNGGVIRNNTKYGVLLWGNSALPFFHSTLLDSNTTAAINARGGCSIDFSQSSFAGNAIVISNNGAGIILESSFLTQKADTGIGATFSNNTTGNIINTITGSHSTDTSSPLLKIDSTSNATKGIISIAPSGGNVGIGTIAPTERLHTYNASGDNTILSEVNGNYFPYIKVKRSGGTTKTNNSWTFGMGSNAVFNFQEWTSHNTLSISPVNPHHGNLYLWSGLVGIGQGNQVAPTTKLDVKNETYLITTFSGTGLNDFTVSDFTGTIGGDVYTITIDGVGTGTGGCDTFSWKKNGVLQSGSNNITLPNIPLLTDGANTLKVNFITTTGHSLNDKWDLTVTLPDILRLRSASSTDVLHLTDSGKLGLGIATPSNQLHMYTSASGVTTPVLIERDVADAAALTLQIDSYGSGAVTGSPFSTGSGYLGRYARGTKAAPTDVAAGDRLGFNVYGGWTGAASGSFKHTAAINAVVDTGVISSTSLPTFINFMTTPVNSTTRTERMRIHSSGGVSIGNTVDSGQGTLSVSNGVVFPYGSGVGRDVSLICASVAADNITQLRIYPNNGVNSSPALELAPKGTGFGSTIKSQLSLYNTDYTSDPTNYENLLLRAAGADYRIISYTGGTGQVRPIKFQMGYNNDALTINADKSVSVATSVTAKTFNETAVTLTPVASTYTPNLSLGSTFIINLGSTNGIGSPINMPVSGLVASITLLIVQTAEGNNTISSWDTNYKWGDAGQPVLSTIGNKIDIITCFTIDGGATWKSFLSGTGF